MAPKAITTMYKGYRFRSRLEARWAVFFDAVPLRWEYEPQGFALPSGNYLPDFWLPDLHAWAEVKPTGDAFEWGIATELAEATQHEVIALIGTPTLQWYQLVHPTIVLDLLDGKTETLVHARDWIDLGSSGRDVRQWVWGAPDYPTGYSPTDYMEQGVNAARSARFEHGETPSR